MNLQLVARVIYLHGPAFVVVVVDVRVRVPNPTHEVRVYDVFVTRALARTRLTVFVV